MIGITADFDLSALNAIIDGDITEWFNELLEDYRTAGKQFVERARSKVKTGAFTGGGFGNITYDLRSSIGYLLVNNGVVIESHFPVISTGEVGAKTGLALAEEIALLVDSGDGVVLVCVAGMEYAAFVEQKGYDVISVSSEVFEVEIKELLAA
jgi:hypothetical protein